jgi:hypothetical protein
MLVSNAAVITFMEKKGGLFPYAAVKHTRQGYYPKWLLLNSKCGSNDIRFRGNSLFLLRTACVTGDVVQSLIISEVALPLPPDFDDVADCMEWWGRCISGQWYLEVLSLFKEYLTPNGFYHVLPTKERLFHDCIFQLIFKKIRDYYAVSPKTFELVHYWQAYYASAFKQTVDFFDIACGSIRETDYLLQQSFVQPTRDSTDDDIPSIVAIPPIVASVIVSLDE